METETVVKDAREVFEGDSLTEFGGLVEQRVMAKTTIKEYEASVKRIDDQLIPLMVQHDCEAVLHGRHKCAIITKENSKLDKDKLKEWLVLNGVPAKLVQDAITQCTVTSNSSYLEVRLLKATAA